MNMQLRCGIPGCDGDAEIIYRGYSLCDSCITIAFEVPRDLPREIMETVCMRATDIDWPDTDNPFSWVRHQVELITSGREA